MIVELTQQKSLYETDYHLWVLETVKKLENRELESLDWENLIEEVLSLGRSDRRKMESLLMRLMEHLLKLAYWDLERERNKGHWEREITNFRKQIKKELKASPSLKRYLMEIYLESYQDGRDLAATHSQLPLSTFPEQPIADLDQVLDEDWFPEVAI